MAPVVGLVGLGLIQRGFPAVGVAQSILFVMLINIHRMISDLMTWPFECLSYYQYHLEERLFCTTKKIKFWNMS